MSQDTSHLRFLSSVTLGPTKGSDTLAQAGDVFTAYFDPDFKEWGTDVPGTDTEETTVAVYEIMRDGTFADFFGPFGLEPQALCLQQGQILEFCRTHRHLLEQEVHSNYFLFEANSEMFVADVDGGTGELAIYANSYSDPIMWDADYRRRVIVPQLKA